MRFLVLGPVEVWRGGEAVSVGGPKARVLLAALALEGNRVVSRSALVEALWGDRPPPSAEKTLDAYLSRLRRALGDDRLLRKAPGYLLVVRPGERDLDQFEQLTSAGREKLRLGDAGAAAALLRRALSLWRGPALADIRDEPFAVSEAEALDERRLAALEDRFDAEIRADGGPRVLEEVERLAREHPLRERLVALHMLALYASGRAPDALTAFQAARHRLAVELGLDPGPQLRQLERQILQQDPSLPTWRPPRRTQRRLHRRSRLWLAAALVACLVGIATAAAALHPTDRGPMRMAPNAVGELRTSGGVAAAARVGGVAGDVAEGAGSLWITDAQQTRLLRLSRSPPRVVDTIAIPAPAPTGVAVGGGGVWVSDFAGRAVSRLNARDPSSRPPLQIAVGAGPGPIAYGFGAAWVVNTVDGTLQRIDAHSLRPDRPVAVGTHPTAVATGSHAVWVTDAGSDSIVRISPSAGTITASYPLAADPVALVGGGSAIWVASKADHAVVRLDPESGHRTVIPMPGAPVDLAYAAGALWVALEHPGGIVTLRAPWTSVRREAVGAAPSAITAAGSDAWITTLPRRQRGGTLRVVYSGPAFDLASPYLHSRFDPGGASTLVQWQLLSMTNDGLVAYRKVGGPAGLEIVPDLAVALPVLSNGGRTYRFLLRRGIRYSNGVAVRASDFRFAVERQFRLQQPGYFQGVVFSSLVGFASCERHPHTCSFRQAIQTDDRAGTLVLHLRRPDPDLLSKLATTFGDLLPPGSPPPTSGEPVPATGPYMLAAHPSPRGRFAVVRNHAFREWSPDAQPNGYPDRILWRRVPDPGRELSAVAARRADVAIDPPPPDQLTQLRTRYVTLAHPYPGYATAFVSLNTRVPPFDDVRVRRAFNLAVDRRRVSTLMGGSLLARPTCQVLPPTLPGYRPYCPYTAHPTPAGSWSAPAPAAARRLVRQSGMRGDHVRLWAWRDGHPAVARYLGRVLETLGYKARVDVVGYDRWNAETSDSRLEGQASLGGWIPDYLSPSAFFDVLLTCHSFRRASVENQNSAELCDHRLDALVQRAESAQAVDPRRAMQLWQLADREATGRAAWVPLTTSVGVDITSPRLRTVQHNTEFGLLLDQLAPP